MESMGVLEPYTIVDSIERCDVLDIQQTQEDWLVTFKVYSGEYNCDLPIKAKNFTFHGTTFKIKYTYSNGKLTMDKNEFNLGDKLDIEGYQDGLLNINNVDLFKSDNKMICNFNENIAKEILTLLDEDMDSDHTFIFNTLSDYSTMIGSGYLSFSFDENDVVLPKLKLDDYDFSIDYKSYNNSVNYKKIEKILENIKIEFPDLISTKKFENMWANIFDQQSYEDYLENIDIDEDVMSEEEYYDYVQDNLVETYCK
jgi:hypothetical protein